jgi:large subunit ribosomal protein L18
MVLSTKLRLVIRFSLRHIQAQLVEATKVGDVTLAAAHSKEVEKAGWKGSLKNTSAAYLTGLLIGKKALALGIETAILDLGLKRPTAGAKVFAVLKGANDAGLRIPHSGRVLPKEDRIQGLHVVTYAKEQLDGVTLRYNGLFTQYLRRSLKPEHLDQHFNDVKKNVLHMVEVEK